MIEKLLKLPIDVSTNGWQVDRLNVWLHILMVVLFVGWIVLFIYMLVRYRKSNHPKADHQGVRSHASSYVEAVVAMLELVLLFGFSLPFWSDKVNAFPAGADAVTVRVKAQQFQWNVQYPGEDGKFGASSPEYVSAENPMGIDIEDPSAKDDIVTINQLNLPVNKPVIVELTTLDVIHSFFLPILRVKQDTIPGMQIPVHFEATKTTQEIREALATTISLPTDRPWDGWVAMEDLKDNEGKILVKKGKLLTQAILDKLTEAGIHQIPSAPPSEIACAQLCGVNHYRMKGYLTIDTQEGYEKWLADQTTIGEEFEE